MITSLPNFQFPIFQLPFLFLKQQQQCLICLIDSYSSLVIRSHFVPKCANKPIVDVQYPTMRCHILPIRTKFQRNSSIPSVNLIRLKPHLNTSTLAFLQNLNPLLVFNQIKHPTPNIHCQQVNSTNSIPQPTIINHQSPLP